VETLYLTPIFQSPSSHRYDTEDYLRVDPHLGGEEALKALYQALEARGMKLVLDGVFNHIGATHPWFQRALKDPMSPERAMFTFYPDGSYQSFFGVRQMPKLDYASLPDPGALRLRQKGPLSATGCASAMAGGWTWPTPSGRGGPNRQERPLA
jgi:alpha-glucosidase